MKITLDVTLPDAIAIIDRLADRARWAEDANYKRLPKDERLRMLKDVRKHIPVIAASMDVAPENLRSLACCVDSIDYCERSIMEEEEQA